MPIKITITSTEGENYPYVLTKSWGDPFDDSSLSKRVVAANTETAYTIEQYYADDSAYSTWETANETSLIAVQTRKAANSITHSVTSETVDSIP